MVNTTYNITEDMIDKLQQLKRKTKLKFYKKIHNYYDEMKNTKIQTQQDTFARKTQGISKIYHEVILIMKFLQTKPQVKNMNNKYYDLYYTVIKNRKEKEYLYDENDYTNFLYFSTPNQFIGIKKDNEMLR